MALFFVDFPKGNVKFSTDNHDKTYNLVRFSEKW